ncbi:hypothetical protein FGB62_29g228 [Gracilaria domingensis]|nr:hypothetical protein FGB62_29g228 [Gracilaria domingensis]
MSDAESLNDSQAPENPAFYSSDASVLASSGSSSSDSEISSDLKELGEGAKKVLKTYTHHLTPITTVPTNGVVLEILEETEDVNKCNEDKVHSSRV